MVPTTIVAAQVEASHFNGSRRLAEITTTLDLNQPSGRIYASMSLATGMH
jgi:hypothetical protein